MKTTTNRLRSMALALALGASLPGCADRATAPDATGGMPAELAPGIYPLLSVASQTSATAQVDLYLKRVPGDTKLASYQGELTYDAALLTLEHTDLPAGIVGTTHEVSPGHVRFAGAALDGLGDVVLVSLRFSRRGSLTKAAFQVKVEEVSGADDFADLTSQVSTTRSFFQGAR
jgi:hypothetical protein